MLKEQKIQIKTASRHAIRFTSPLQLQQAPFHKQQQRATDRGAEAPPFHAPPQEPGAEASPSQRPAQDAGPEPVRSGLQRRREGRTAPPLRVPAPDTSPDDSPFPHPFHAPFFVAPDSYAN